MNLALQDRSHDALTELPEILKNVQSLQNDILQLKTQITIAQSEIIQVHSETGGCIENLAHLDTLKKQLEVAKQGLQESDGWEKQCLELEDLFERSDLERICDRIGQLQKSLVAQERLPGQSEREIQVEGFKNRLEALASPAVIKYISASDAEQTKKYVKIFSVMNRVPQLLQYYQTVQITSLQQHWKKLLDFSENSNRFLYDFYEFLAENYQKQCRWFTQVFGTNIENKSAYILIELLSSLQPSREFTILNVLKTTNKKLDVLVQFSEANLHFARIMTKQFESCGKLNERELEKFSVAIFDYFNTFIAQYPTIEHNFLASNLADLQTNLLTEDIVRELEITGNKIFKYFSDALIRCEKITGYCAIASLTNVFNSILKIVVEKYKQAQQKITVSQNITQNFNTLQSCMNLLESIGYFLKSLKSFENNLSEKIMFMYNKMQKSEENCFGYRITEIHELNNLKKLSLSIQTNNSSLVEEYFEEKGLFFYITKSLRPLCHEIHGCALAAIFLPIEKQLENILPKIKISSSSNDLPDYSYAPQEYITQIGQYLLTLPQHLEPLLLSPSSSLKSILKLCDSKYIESTPCADTLLSLVIDEFYAIYQNKILNMESLSLSGAKQIAVDIDYVGNVIEELGLILNKQLQQIMTLLRSSPEKYLAESTGYDPRLVTAIRQMRNIISTE